MTKNTKFYRYGVVSNVKIKNIKLTVIEEQLMKIKSGFSSKCCVTKSIIEVSLEINVKILWLLQKKCEVTLKIQNYIDLDLWLMLKLEI